MTRPPAGLLVVATSSSVMMGLVLVAGLLMPSPTEPNVLPPRLVRSPTNDASTCLETPLTASATSGISGQGLLCDNGAVLRVTLSLRGLTPAETYAVWLGSVQHPASCLQTPCGLVDLQGESPVGSMHHVVEGIVSPSRALELRGELRDVHLVSGAQIWLLLVRQRGAAGPDAQAILIVP